MPESHFPKNTLINITELQKMSVIKQNGRKSFNVYQQLYDSAVDDNDKNIWFDCAMLCL
jgi:hypothetical protein